MCITSLKRLSISRTLTKYLGNLCMENSLLFYNNSKATQTISYSVCISSKLSTLYILVTHGLVSIYDDTSLLFITKDISPSLPGMQ